jgi:4-amino-4-deoxy-L-arabinose transferase-like glycosyltransferase
MFLGALRIIPLLLAWAGCYRLFRELAARGRINPDRRISLLLASGAWGALVAFITEICGLYHALTPLALFPAWDFVIAMLWMSAAWLAHARGRLSRSAAVEFWSDCRMRYSDVTRSPIDVRLMLLAVALLVLVPGVLALLTPTTNWDSLTYHLPRVMHWIQQQSLEPYATNNTRQIEFAPWSAFVITQLHLLSGTDQFDNLVQWFAMVICLFAVSLIAQQLFGISRGAGAGAADTDLLGNGNRPLRQTAALSCLLLVTLPIGIVESITTQTDYVVTCWFISLTCLLLALWREPANFWYGLGAGLALALGVLTKATMLVYAAPLGVAFLVWWLVELRNGRLRLRTALLFVGLVLALNGPHWLRNLDVFGSPLGSRRILAIERNGKLSVGGTLSNIIRNLSLETNTGIQPLTDAINRGLLGLHRLTGRRLNDPDTTYHLGAFSTPDGFSLYDSDASSFYHLALVLICMVILLRRPRDNGVWLGYGLSAVAGFILFCTFLRWQQWHSRIHLAWLVFLTPLTAGTLASKVSPSCTRIIATALLFFALVCLTLNRSCPLGSIKLDALSRERRQLTLFGEPLYEPLVLAARDISVSGCPRVGLKMDFDDPEYSVWVFLRNRGFAGRIDHVGVENESARLAAGSPDPGLVLCTSETFPQTVAARFPYQTVYGAIRVFWSEAASRWADLVELRKRTQTVRRLPRESGRIEMEGGTATLSLRTIRAGKLHLSGRMMDSRGGPIVEGAVRLSTASGFEQTQPVTGGRISLTVPSTAGLCLIQVDITGSTNVPAAHWDRLEWTWAPD